MPFIPHTEADVRDMLGAIGANSLNELFSEIPTELRCGKLSAVPEGLSEMEVSQLMRARARLDGGVLNFIGAGAYEHHIPAAVWEITTRGEFYSAYTPYQAEASQGTLQLLYEFQSMMTALNGLEVSNASMYDGASALAEAVLMAERVSPNAQRRVLVPRTLNPVYRSVLKALISAQNIELIEVDYQREGEGAGRVSIASLQALGASAFTSLIVPQPNYFGVLEDVDALTDWAHAQGALVIAVVNPLSLAILKAPGQWGSSGADISVGDGQPLGVPLSSGGPYFGFLTAKKEFVRQMPGRIVGRTLDLDGKPGFTLTLQAREQHIRRSKATSNICTNQGLLVTAATIHMSLLGAEGLARVASSSMRNLGRLTAALSSVPGVSSAFSGAHFHERVLQLPRSSADVLTQLAARNVLGGVDLSRDYPELGQAILVCATETKTEAHIETYRLALAAALAAT